ncbi:MAG: hypothetical protein IPL71_12550 [Anaerolineales bacterium]|uniref:hypothetical protein n=1 Tax=Candidatus Villigracilis proximus TaxID=3140683 RepID=UPI003134FF25|nr:hypothetical protein [Anaerolineales bacterium]
MKIFQIGIIAAIDHRGDSISIPAIMPAKPFAPIIKFQYKFVQMVTFFLLINTWRKERKNPIVAISPIAINAKLAFLATLRQKEIQNKAHEILDEKNNTAQKRS